MNNKHLSPRLILAFIDSLHEITARAKLNGIYDFANQHGWQIQVFAGQITTKEFTSLVREWQPNGCIIDGKLLNRDFPAPKTKEMPIVQLGNSYDISEIRDTIGLDNQLIAKTAAKIINKPNIVGFGYVSAPNNPTWSHKRGQYFLSAIRKANKKAEILANLSENNQPGNLKSCARFLRKLPKPAGIMLASDYVAPLVYTAAKAASLHIPNDVCIISVDNDSRICENLTPPLTSIEPDCARGGFLSAERLYARISGMTEPLCKQRYGIASVSFRQSIQSDFSDYRVRNAINWITQHAKMKIGVPEIVAVMGCRRRTAEQTFKNVTGKSIHAYIEDARFENVLKYVGHNKFTISTIADLCGFSSAAYLSTAFKRRYGTTIAQWRTKGIP